MNVKLLALLLWLPIQAAAQGFAGLGTGAEGFADPQRGTSFTFPADHGAHPAYRIEWWYLTANLRDAEGRDFGIQWTLFRSALAPEARADWSSPQVWMGHAALTTPDAHHVAERLGRDGTGQAGVTAQPFRAWIDDWHLAGGSTDTLSPLEVTARGTDFAYRLRLAADRPVVAQGDNGYSVKSPEGQASYYYSQPFYRVSGTLDLPEGPVEVTGQGWLDREWSSQPLSDSQDGWDWISLHLEDGAKVMGFRLRDRAGQDFTSATWIAPDGTAMALGDGALRMTPLAHTRVAGRRLPTRWRVELPAQGLDLTLAALNPRAWMATGFPYWEGPVTVTGSHAGRGYLEMTGY